MAERRIDINQPAKGLNSDAHPSNLDSRNAYTHALNARQESEDGGQLNITNESSTTYALPFEYTVIGRLNIVEIGRTIFWLVGPNGESEIGYVDNDIADCVDTINLTDPDTNPCVTCGDTVTPPVLGEDTTLNTDPCLTYHKIVNSDCLNFSINHPIHSTEYKITNKTVEIYWTDDYNPMRWLDINKVPLLSNGTLNCNLIKIMPDYKVPTVKVVDEFDNGSIKAGSVQFLVAYANSKGEEISQYYSITNPAGVWENKPGTPLDFQTNKSVQILIENLDTQFKYINIAVIKTSGGTRSTDIVGTYSITGETLSHLYTGNDKSPREISLEELLFRAPYYERAGTLEAQNNILLMGNMHSSERINYQSVANRIKLQWETWRIPYNKHQGYANATNTSNFRSFMRDEVYGFDIVLLDDRGHWSDRFHVPGPKSKPTDWDIITNLDAQNSGNDPCETAVDIPRWKVYNTAELIGNTQEYDNYVAVHPEKCYTVTTNTSTYSPSATTTAGYSVDIDELITGRIQIKKSSTTMPSSGDKYSEITITLDGTYTSNVDLEFAYAIPNNYYGAKGMDVYGADNGMVTIMPQFAGKVGQSTLLGDSRNTPWKVTIPAGTTTITVDGVATSGPVNSMQSNRWGYHKEYRHIWIRSRCNDVDFFVEYEDDTSTMIELEGDGLHNIDDEGCETAGGTTTTTGTITTTTHTETVCLVDNCYIGPYQYGDFGYYESTETYPNDPVVWEELAGQKIRHHKFPDNIISPIHDNNPLSDKDINFEHAIFPIGVRMDKKNILDAIKNSSIPDDVKSRIVGVKLLRTYRGKDKSVLAKGLLYNVGKYTTSNVDYMYPNYPFNDVSLDPFLSKDEKLISPRSGSNYEHRLDGFGDADFSGKRYTFHSPDTAFRRPPLGTILKLETVEYGKADTHLVKVLNNAKYTIGTKKGVKMATTLALSTVMSIKMGGGITGFDSSVEIELGNFVANFGPAFDLVKKLIPFREYAYAYHAVGNYCTTKGVPNDTGNKIRNIELGGYVDSGSYNLYGDLPINNFQRESTVYVRTSSSLPYTHQLGVPQDNTRYTFSSYKDETGKDLAEGEKVRRNVSSYYASIKREVPDQYGQVYSYESFDTGSLYYLTSNNPYERIPTIFGGDTFITRFGFKRKIPFFLSNTVGAADDQDIFYNKLANVAYPTYYLSTGPIKYELSQKVKDAFDHAYKKANQTDFGSGVLAAISGGKSRFVPLLQALLVLTGDIIQFLGIKDVNFDKYEDKGYFEEGAIYLFAYGVPYFFVESDINLDYRQAENTVEKNFYPNVGTDIPDLWLQEKTVSIAHDNYYYYNFDLSKNNRENYFTTLPLDFDPTIENVDHHSTRVIYSETTNLEEKQNNWLVFRANNYKDLPLTNGALVDINALESQKILLRFENNVAVANAYTKIATDNKTAVIGDGSMFSTPTQEYAQTDVGYAGTQHKAFCSTKYGSFWIDAKRGEVFLLQGNKAPKEISRAGMRNWLKENLPFKIARSFKNVPVDNSFKDIGIAMVWDNRYERLLITKRDFVPLSKDITYDSTAGVFRNGEAIVSTEDRTQFCDASWTIGYSPITESWISFYSFIPHYYVEQQNYFQSGFDNKLWNHLLTNKSYQVFYGTFYPFEIETITKTDLNSKVLTNVSYRNDVLRYTNGHDWKYMKDITFNEALIHSTESTSGKLLMSVRDKNDMSSGITTNYTAAGINIVISEMDGIWRFNKFSDVVKDHNSLTPILSYGCNNVSRDVNMSAVDYSRTTNMATRGRLKSDYFKVRLTNSEHSRYKFVYKWIVSNSVPSSR